MEKYIKSSQAIKNQIANRFIKQSETDLTSYSSYKLLNLFENFDAQIQKQICNIVHLKNNELPVILMSLKPDEFVLVTTENIFIKNKSFIKSYANGDLKTGFWDFLETIFERKVERNFNRSETSNTIKMKQEGFELDFRFEFNNEAIEIIKFPTGSAPYSFMNTLNVIKLVGKKYLIQ